MSDSVVVTGHGASRLRKRLGVPKRAVARMATKALADGYKPSDFPSHARRLLDGVTPHRGVNEQPAAIRVYNQHLFLFAGTVLITAWRLRPDWLRGAVHG